MEEQEVSRGDYEFLWRIMSLQHALVSSAADPVVLRKVREGADFDMAVFSGMYYDCCENEARAKETVRKRVDVAEEDIRGHFRLHKSCLDSFLAMDGAIITDDREVFSEKCGELCESVSEYVELVKTHKQRLDTGFLIYPTCPPGHFFHVLNGPYVKNCALNEYESHLLATNGIKSIQEQIIDFKIRQEQLPYIALPLDEQQGAGLLLDHFSKNLATNKLLLKRVGLELEI